MNIHKIKTLTGSRALDFWLIGGASMLIYIILNIIYYFKLETMPGLAEYFTYMAGTMFMLAALCNNPHFIASYKMAYTRGIKNIFNSPFQLLIVPLSLLLLIILAYQNYNESIPLYLNNFLPKINLFNYQSVGQLILGSLVNFMFLTVGWHYVKQAFGVTMVYASYDNFKFNKLERLVIRYSLLSLWLLSFTYNNVGRSLLEFSGLKYQGYNLPTISASVSLTICNLMIASTITIFIFKYFREDKLPSLNMLIPIIAIYAWFYPTNYMYTFSAFLVPFFHSLQYLAFTFKVEQESLLDSVASAYKNKQSFYSKYIKSISFTYISLIFVGWLCFELIPKLSDYFEHSVQNYHISFFLISFLLFINIHHYFIDNILWRFNGENIKKLLR